MISTSFTCSCYHRLPLLAAPERRDLFLTILEEVRQAYRFEVIGYVVMPEHFHLLMSEPEVGDPSTAMKVLKMRFARRVHKTDQRSSPLLWQKRFYDFNVCTKSKRIEKLRYIHRNPVTRGLVGQPDQWTWSSFRSYLYGEPGRVHLKVLETARLTTPDD